MREFKVNDNVVNDDSEAYVIAEIGNNHQGSVEICKQMFDAAKESGAKAVKMQKRDNKTLFTKAAYDGVYNSNNAFGRTYGEHREKLEFGKPEYVELKAYAEELGLDFFATAFDLNSADFLADLDICMYKFASADLKNIPLLKHVASIGKPMLLSTGGGVIEDVQRAVETLLPINSQLAVLQCTAAYPCQPEEMNLRVISTYRDMFPDQVIGLSDHQSGISMALVAFTLGARIFEKHFTLDRTWKGTDHAFSLSPKGLSNLVRDLKRARVALGDGVKTVQDSEQQPVFKMGKKIVAMRDLEAGEIITEDMIGYKCPADGMHPYEVDKILGRKLKQDLPFDGDFSLDIVE